MNKDVELGRFFRYLHADYEAGSDAAYRLIHLLSSHAADLVCLRRSIEQHLAIRPLATEKRCSFKYD